MRLINVHTLELSHFLDAKPPPYAILSHTWGDDEVTFQDIQNLERARAKKDGFSKIQFCCRQANQDGLEWAWVDTCCIDKTSSAELSETINSMFRYYTEAFICYAYLYDVELPRGNVEGQLKAAKWFTRGWTLQELIAPFDVVFYDVDWARVGAKSQLATYLEGATGIPEGILNHCIPLQDVSVYRRMRWASNRCTTRVEDVAYCLLGIFDISMPLLYGEGKKAFIRLEKEILSSSHDPSLLAWGTANGGQVVIEEDGVAAVRRDAQVLREAPLSGALAESPADFQPIFDHLGNEFVISLEPERFTEHPPEFHASTGTIRVAMRLRKVGHEELRLLVPYLQSIARRGYVRRLSEFNISVALGSLRLDESLDGHALYLGCFEPLGSFQNSTLLASPCFLLARRSTGEGERPYFTRFRQIINCISVSVQTSWELTTCSIAMKYSLDLWEGDENSLWLDCTFSWLEPKPSCSWGPVSRITRLGVPDDETSGAMSTFQFQLHPGAPFVLIVCGICTRGYVLKVFDLERQANVDEIHRVGLGGFSRGGGGLFEVYRGSGPVARAQHRLGEKEIIATLVVKAEDGETLFRNNELFVALR